MWDAKRDAGPFRGGMDLDVLDTFVKERKDYVVSELGIPPLGSGSDYTPFLQHLGVRLRTITQYRQCTDIPPIGCQHGSGLQLDTQ